LYFWIFNLPEEQPMRVHAYLNFNGQCAQAFKFYEECLGGKIGTMMTHAGTPMEEHVPSEWRDKVLHASLFLGDDELMGSDAPPGRYEKPSGFSVTLQIKEFAEAERIFNALLEEGTVVLPFQETFWAFRFGMLVDRFGIPWMVNCENAG
jgi:PhnB protein